MTESALRALSSPIIFRGDACTAYRDPAAIYADGWYHLFFTLTEIEPDGTVYMYLAKSKSRDLTEWEPIRKLTPRDRRLNYSSPGNVVRFGGRYHLCVQTYPRENGEMYGNEKSRLFDMTTDDLETFDEPRMLMVKGDIPVEDMGRMIDPYLLQDAADPEKWWCFYKQNGVSMSHSRDLVHWTYAGHADSGENVCAVRTEDRYLLYHSPDNGIGILESEDCVNWRDTGILLTLGQDEWTWASGRITAGCVVDAPSEDGAPLYLIFFHGSAQSERISLDTNASLGIAWSRDLINWEWPK